MKNWIYILLFNSIFLLNYNETLSTILYVKHDATGGGNGSSWADAYITLQEALDVASSGYEIWVARGIYKPTSDYGRGGVRYNHFRMIDGVAIYGGFSGTETSISQRNNYGDGETNETFLSGDLNGNSQNDNSDTYHIFFHPNGLTLTNSAILNGFSLVFGSANGNIMGDELTGGAVYNYQNNKTPIFENIIFKNNYANFGSAIWNDGSSPIFINCFFRNNSGGGVIWNQWGSNTEVYSSIFSNNSGNALVFYQLCNPKITNVLIYNNTSVNVGGAIGIRNDCNATFTNVTITNNEGPVSGGGLDVQYDCSIIMKNSIIYGNTSAGAGDDINILDNSSITIQNSCYNNSAAAFNVDVTSSYSSTNSINSDPLFLDESNDDYRLSKTSPCLDAGNNSYNSEIYDIRGDYPRKLNKNSQSSGTIDIGAYEFRAGYDAIVISTNSATNIETDAATSGAILFADLFTPIIAKGIVWDTLSSPTISLSTKTNEGTTNGLFTSSLSGLIPNKTYYVRSYITNSSSTTYGNEISFTTLPYGIGEDGNQDGIIDTLQTYVYNYYDENSGNYITIESLQEDTIFDVSKLSVYEDKYYYPLGLMSFKVKASFSTIKIYYHGISSLQNCTYRKQKLDGTYYDFSNATFSIETISGNPTAVVILNLQDGKTGDLDGSINGIIYDPGGPAISTVAIPTLSEWARGILLTSFLIFSVYYLKRIYL